MLCCHLTFANKWDQADAVVTTDLRQPITCCLLITFTIGGRVTGQDKASLILLVLALISGKGVVDYSHRGACDIIPGLNSLLWVQPIVKVPSYVWFDNRKLHMSLQTTITIPKQINYILIGILVTMKVPFAFLFWIFLQVTKNVSNEYTRLYPLIIYPNVCIKD